MSETETLKQKKKQKPFLLCTIMGTLLASLLFSILIEWIGIAFFWTDEGALHSKQVMLEEFEWFSEGFQHSLLYAYPVQLAHQVIEFIYQWIFIKSGLLSWLNSPKEQGSWAMYIIFYIGDYIEAILYVMITFIIRLMIIILTSPLFVLVAIVGLTDGLVQRDLRRFGVGRESAFKYHHAKKSIGPIMILAWVIYLSIPFSIHPNLILIPAAILFGLMIALTASNFKKYL